MRPYALGVMVGLATSPALAQNTNSSIDPPAPSGMERKADPKQSSPKETGAMQNESAGVATDPDQVRAQSKGGVDAGRGQTSPGTVGATPGSDEPRPEKK
ncbi:hypothetical protein METY_2825 [Methylopila sp. Yamaguchi]|nr:hypothetical protein METY_2825 [Methylopila sp. Yamaguchi]